MRNIETATSFALGRVRRALKTNDVAAENKRTRWRRFELPNYYITCVYFSAHKVAMQKNKLSMGYYIKKSLFWHVLFDMKVKVI